MGSQRGSRRSSAEAVAARWQRASLADPRDQTASTSKANHAWSEATPAADARPVPQALIEDLLLTGYRPVPVWAPSLPEEPALVPPLAWLPSVHLSTPIPGEL